MMFNLTDMEDLLRRPCAELETGSPEIALVYDKLLYDKVWHRSQYLRELKEKLGEIAQECHQMEMITGYIKACKQQTNFDLSHEA